MVLVAHCELHGPANRVWPNLGHLARFRELNADENGDQRHPSASKTWESGTGALATIRSDMKTAAGLGLAGNVRVRRATVRSLRFQNASRHKFSQSDLWSPPLLEPMAHPH